MSVALFSFGTLMDADLLTLVCGQTHDELHVEPASVADFAPFWVRDDHYPVLLEQPGAVAQGRIIRGLTPEGMQRVIFFEGDEFQTAVLEVINASGEQEQVCYFADTQRMVVSDRPWQLADWQRESKPDMLKRVERYMDYFGQISASEASDASW